MAAETLLIQFIIGEKKYAVEVAASLLTEADDFFQKIDADMDCGWQMSRQWVEKPDTMQRCQILADRVLTALHKGNQQMVELSTAYILKNLPGVTQVDIDIDGDMTQTRFEVDHRPLSSIS